MRRRVATYHAAPYDIATQRIRRERTLLRRVRIVPAYVCSEFANRKQSHMLNCLRCLRNAYSIASNEYIVTEYI